MRVREILQKKSTEVVTVASGEDLGTAVLLLMRHGVGGLPVVTEAGVPIGFLSERDVVSAVERYDGPIRHVRVEQLMRPLPECSADDRLEDVMSRMTRHRLRHLVVLDKGRLVGVISVGDLVKQRLEQLETETGVLRDYVAAQRASRL